MPENKTSSGELTPEGYFEGHPDGLAVFQTVRDVVADLGEASVRVTRSQIAFRRRTGFAYVWRPGQYVRNPVPAVVTIALPHPVASSRFKSVVHPSPNVWMHHLEVAGTDEIDGEVRLWLADAYANAA